VLPPATAQFTKRTLPFDKPVKCNAKRTDRKEDSSNTEAASSEDADIQQEDSSNTTPTTTIKRLQARTPPGGMSALRCSMLW